MGENLSEPPCIRANRLQREEGTEEREEREKVRRKDGKALGEGAQSLSFECSKHPDDLNISSIKPVARFAQVRTGSPTDDLFPCVKRGGRSIPILRQEERKREREREITSLDGWKKPSPFPFPPPSPLTSIFRPRKLLRGRKKKGGGVEKRHPPSSRDAQ